MQNKELWFETKFIKTTQGYKASKKHVGIGSHFIVNLQIKIYEKIIRQNTSGLLLDLGCGNVPLYGIYKDKVVDNICVDWNNTLHKNPYLDYEIDLNNKIPLESEQFDTILCTDVLEHIANPELLMSEVARLLKPNGKAIITVPFFYWLHEHPYDFFRYTEYALKMFCEKNNLTIILLDPYGGAPEVILDIISKQLMQVSTRACKIHSFLSSVMIEFPLIKKISQKSSRGFPLMYCLVAQKPSHNTNV